MGSLVSKWTSINIPLELSRYKNQMGEEVVTTVQSVLNDLLPGLAALGLTFLCMYLLRKKSQRHVHHLRLIRRRYFRLSFWCVSVIYYDIAFPLSLEGRQILAWHINPMNLKDLIKPPPAEGYIKNSSNLVTALFCSGGHSLLSHQRLRCRHRFNCRTNCVNRAKNADYSNQ